MRLMACFGVVVLLVILDSLSKALATGEESKRNTWLKSADKTYDIGGPPFDRDLRWDSPQSFGRVPRTVKSLGSFGRIPRTVKTMGSFGRIPRTYDDSVGEDSPSFDREIRWHARRAPQIAKMRPPRNGMDNTNNVDDKFLEEMSRRAWGARFMPGTKNGKRDWEAEDNFAFNKRSDEEQALFDAIMDIYDAKNTYNNKEE